MRWITLVLLLFLATPADASLWKHGWYFSASAGATRHYWCWTSDPTDWWSGQCQTVTAADCPVVPGFPYGLCFAPMPCAPPGKVVYFMAVACNSNGCNFKNKDTARQMRWCP